MQLLINTPTLNIQKLLQCHSLIPINTHICNIIIPSPTTMASSFCYTILLILVLVSTSHAQTGLVLPLRRDAATSQFYTTFQMGSNRATINAVVHLSGQHLWFDCDNYTSATYAPIPCDSAKCEAADGMGCNGCNGPARPGCTNNTCGTASSNPFIFYITSNGLYEDTFSSKDRVELPEFIFSCVNSDYLAGLASAAAGMVGLGRRFDTAFHKVVADKLNLPNRFSICPPSAGIGKLTIGGGLPAKSDISGMLKSTPLIVNKPVSNQPFFAQNDLSEEYFIDVRSIRVAGEAVEVKESYFAIGKDRTGGTKISSVQNYTAMHTSILKPLARAFDKAAADLGMRSAAAVAPFRACYRAETVKRTAAGPEVPAIDLVLPGNDVYWRISGANSMVEVDRKTMCLALVDAGSRPTTSVVIGAHQLEENFLEFDVAASQLRFSSSLLVNNKSCSRL
ncbi:probable aspartic proteinase GIP2 [Salvia miltiorrhiza]|uniref:probable aspartic proteinase GIP2 n=1 Tax=Salvia miltiorrhiza TaxID=226208 RepID=UPI0025AC8FCE|nr:probable aspartic proteinase GIP2 [Salvia miltiorrhiza]